MDPKWLISGEEFETLRAEKGFDDLIHVLVENHDETSEILLMTNE